MEQWRLRQIANWVNASTPVGLAVARLGRATVCAGPRDLMLATGYGLGFPAAPAFTIGSVVLTRHSLRWLAQRPDLLAHEERHTTQYAGCGGLPFIPLYLLATAYSQWKVGDRGAANVFERLAGLESGGYRVPSRAQVRTTKRTRSQRRRTLVAPFARLVSRPVTSRHGARASPRASRRAW